MPESKGPLTATSIAERLTRPSTAIKSEELRQMARILAALTLFLLATVLIFGAVWVISAPGYAAAPWISLGLLLVFSLNYGISRTQYFRSAATLNAVSILVLVIAVLINAPGPLTERMLALKFLVLSPLLTGAFLKRRYTLLLTFLSLGLILYFYTRPDVPAAVTSSYLSFFVLVTALGTVGALMAVVQKQQIRQSEERYRAVIAALSEGVMILDRDGRIEETNTAAERILGLRAAEMIGRDSGDPRWQATREDGSPFPRAEHPAIRTLLDGQALSEVVMGVHQAGDGERWISVNSQPVLMPGKSEPHAVVASFTDITERRRAEEALRDRENNLRTLFDSIDDFFFVLDVDGRIIAINETVRRRLGYCDADLIGQSVLLVHPPERREEAARVVAAMLNGTASRCFVPLMTADGVMIPVETAITRGLWNGQPALFGVTKDISELKVSEEKYAAAFHENPALAGLSRIDTGEYVEVNKAFCEKLGFTPEEVIGSRSTDLVKLDTAFRQEMMRQLAENGEVRDIETTLTGRQGAKIPVLLSARMLNINGALYNFTTAIDLTERRQVEQRSFELALEQESHRVLRHFVEIASHEFRTPLSIIQLMVSAMAGNADEQARRDKAERVEQQVLRIVRLVDSMLTLVKLDAASSIPMRDLRVAPLISAVCRGVEKDFGPVIGLSMQLDLPEVIGSEEYLGEALRQLLDNARRFSPPGGRIMVRVGREAQALWIEVEDEGSGIAAEDLERVFETFWRSDHAHSTPGFGLGLPIVRRIVDLHKGQVTLRSQPGKGTTVRIELPVAELQAEGA